MTAKLANDLVQAKQEIRDLKIQMSQQTSINAHLRHQQTEADMYEKRLNLIFTGIDESPQENLGNWFNDLCENTLKLDDSIELNDIMRLGRVRHDDRIPTRKRPILVKLAYMKDKQKIMKERRNLTDTGIFMNEDYPVEEEAEKAQNASVVHLTPTRPNMLAIELPGGATVTPRAKAKAKSKAKPESIVYTRT